MGCGRVGSALARDLNAAGHDIVIVDRDQGALAKAATRGMLGADFRGQVVIGDGCDAEVQRRAGIEECDALVAVTEGDNRNIMASQIARHVFNVQNVVCRIYDPIREEAYRKMGLNTFCPTIIGAKTVSAMLGVS